MCRNLETDPHDSRRQEHTQTQHLERESIQQTVLNVSQSINTRVQRSERPRICCRLGLMPELCCVCSSTYRPNTSPQLQLPSSSTAQVQPVRLMGSVIRLLNVRVLALHNIWFQYKRHFSSLTWKYMQKNQILCVEGNWSLL